MINQCLDRGEVEKFVDTIEMSYKGMCRWSCPVCRINRVDEAVKNFEQKALI